jgi:hypothetical protein
MATASTTAGNNTKTTPAGEATDIAQKFREQLVSNLQQTQKFSVDAAKEWAKAVSVLAIPDLPKIPGLPDAPNLETTTKYTFDVAADLLKAQREFVLNLTNVVVPAKTL